MGILGEQNKSNLAKYIAWLDTEQYQATIDWIFVKDRLSFLKKNKESSANKRRVKETPFLPNLTPLISLQALTLMRDIDRMFAHKRNKEIKGLLVEALCEE